MSKTQRLQIEHVMTPLEELKVVVKDMQTKAVPHGRVHRALNAVQAEIDNKLQKVNGQLIKTISKHDCPVCHKPLAKEQTHEGVSVFCPYGPCPGRCTNDGGVGPDEDAAYRQLEANVERELEGGAE